jgi:hypothetical protein
MINNSVILIELNQQPHNIVYTPYAIVTAFADEEPYLQRAKIQAKPAPINGAYTNR